jgi:hypothetical protein
MDVRLYEEHLALEGCALRTLTVTSAPHCASSPLFCGAVARLRTIDGYSNRFVFILLPHLIYLEQRRTAREQLDHNGPKD